MNGLDKKAPLTDEEQKAFQELYQTHQRRVYSTCLRMTRDISEAEDLTQEVFVHLFRALGSFRGESAFTTWLHRLTVNHVLMHFRKRKVRAVRPTEDGELPVQALAAGHDHKRTNIVDRILLSEVISKLPDGYREALILHDIEGFEHKEIAEMRGSTEGTSKSQLHKARRALRALITQLGPEQIALGRNSAGGEKKQRQRPSMLSVPSSPKHFCLKAFVSQRNRQYLTILTLAK